MVAWACVISLLSSDLFSGEHTGGFLLPILEVLLPGAAPQTLLDVHAAVRKLAHLTEYAILAVLLVRALARPERSAAATAALALAIAAAYAGADELRQTWVPSRMGSPVDVAIDVCGAAIGVTAALVFSAGRRSPA